MVASAKIPYGVGIYSPAEAAYYARMRTESLKRWLYGTSTGNRVLTPQYPPENDGYHDVSFVDLIQSLAVREARVQTDVSLQKIRQAVEAVEREGISYPLARPHGLYVFPEGRTKNIVIGIGDDLDKLVFVTGKQKGQQLIPTVVQTYLQRITWSDEEDRVASRFDAWTYRDAKVIIDPERHFGQPYVDGTGFAAEDLFEAVRIEGGLENAAAAYGVEVDHVIAACEYFSSLGVPT